MCFHLSAVLSLVSATCSLELIQTEEWRECTHRAGWPDGGREREWKTTYLQKKEMVRDGSMALGEIKGPHVKK